MPAGCCRPRCVKRAGGETDSAGYERVAGVGFKPFPAALDIQTPPGRQYILCVTTDILAEYAEIIGQQMGPLAGESVLGVIENLPNVSLVTAYFRFRLLGDEDDDKCADCAVAGNADCIVTHDRDFKRLATIEFPKIEVMDTHQFKRLLDA